MESQELTHITALSTQSDSAVEALLDSAFVPDRIKRTAYQIRTGMMPIGALSFSALDGQHNFIGLLQSWPVPLEYRAGRANPPIRVSTRKRVVTGTSEAG